jgi:hypothetical protein
VQVRLVKVMLAARDTAAARVGAAAVVAVRVARVSTV